MLPGEESGEEGALERGLESRESMSVSESIGTKVEGAMEGARVFGEGGEIGFSRVTVAWQMACGFGDNSTRECFALRE